MRVGVDATTWANPRGYGRFTRSALRHLVELDRETRYVLYLDGATSAVDVPLGAEQRLVQLAATNGGASRPASDLVRLTRAARRERLDAFVFPTVYSYFPLSGAPTVVGVHDAITSELPRLTLPTRRARLLWRAKERLAVRGATRVFTVSEASRRSLVQHLGLDASTVAVVPEAPDSVFSPRGDDEVRRATASVGLPEGAPYVVYAAGIAPHKNLETLLEALAATPETSVRLVLAGALDDDPFLSAGAAVREQVARLGLGDRVELCGHLPDETLAALYTGASAAVVPSLAEGFGLPAVEAAACGAPVVLSDIPAHRETLDGAAMFFPPRDSGALAVALERVFADGDLRRSLGGQARQAVSALSWDATAELLRVLVHDAAAEGRHA